MRLCHSNRSIPKNSSLQVESASSTPQSAFTTLLLDVIQLIRTHCTAAVRNSVTSQICIHLHHRSGLHKSKGLRRKRSKSGLTKSQQHSHLRQILTSLVEILLRWVQQPMSVATKKGQMADELRRRYTSGSSTISTESGSVVRKKQTLLNSTLSHDFQPSCFLSLKPKVENTFAAISLTLHSTTADLAKNLSTMSCSSNWMVMTAKDLSNWWSSSSSLAIPSFQTLLTQHKQHLQTTTFSTHACIAPTFSPSFTAAVRVMPPSPSSSQ